MPLPQNNLYLNRERMVQLDNFVMMRWEAEATVVPAESRFQQKQFFQLYFHFSAFSFNTNVQYLVHFFHSSHFGFFAPGEIDIVESLQETELYQEDFIGDIYKTLLVIFSRLLLAILSFPTHLDKNT